MDEEIVESNLELLTSEDPGGFKHALAEESMGGQLGYHDGVPCSNVPFFYDMQNGTIHWCGSHKNVPEDIMNDYSFGRFRITQPTREPGQIVEAQAEHAQREARQNIEEAVRRYNEIEKTA